VKIIKKLTASDREWTKSIFRQYWGADFVVSSRDGVRHAADLAGFYACDENGERTGLITYRIDGAECEMVTLNAFAQFAGIGSILVNAVKDVAVRGGCSRLWLITTNDNLEAIRFYQKRGFQLVAVHPNALDVTRRYKPNLPEIGNFGIPLRDELEFEMRL